jgi:hypothetical protein
MKWSRLVLVIGVMIALIGSGIGYIVAESEHQNRGWIRVELKNVGTEEMVAALIVSGANCKSFSVSVVNLSANQTLNLGLDVRWHSNNTFWIDAWCGANATPTAYQTTYKIVKAIKGDVVNVTLSLDMALVKTPQEWLEAQGR